MTEQISSLPVTGYRLSDLPSVTPSGSQLIEVGGSVEGVATLDSLATWVLRNHVIGTHVQAFDADLSAIAALTPADGNFLVGNGTTWVAESGATARASLGLTIGTHVQAFDADLSAIAALTPADGNFLVGNGTTWVAESGATARESLGAGQWGVTITTTPGNMPANQYSIGNTPTSGSTLVALLPVNRSFDEQPVVMAGAAVLTGFRVNVFQASGSPRTITVEVVKFTPSAGTTSLTGTVIGTATVTTVLNSRVMATGTVTVGNSVAGGDLIFISHRPTTSSTGEVFYFQSSLMFRYV